MLLINPIMKTILSFNKPKLLSFFLLLPFFLLAQAPITPSMDFSTSSINGDELRINFTKGDGAKRIIVAKLGSAVTAVPSDGADYTPGAFGAGNQILPGEYVVYEGTGQSNIIISGLQHSTEYHFRIYEFNGSASTTEYLISSYLIGDEITLTYPTTQASNIQFSNVLGSTMTVSWDSGNGTGRILIARENSPIDVNPSDLTNYSSSTTFGSASTEIGTGNYVMRIGNNTSANITNLDPNTTYYFALFEYNGTSDGKVYLTSLSDTNPIPGATANQLTEAYPTDNATNMTFSNINGNEFYRVFSNGHGNGEKRIVVAKQGSPVTGTPVDGTDYTASTTFGSGDELLPLGSGEYVMYDGINGTGWTYGLLPDTEYFFKVFEYNGSGTETFYLVANDDGGDPVYETSQSTLDYPTSQASFAVSPFSNIEGTQMTVSWSAGTGGSGRILLAKEGAPVDAEPQDFVNYNTSTTFGNGTQIGTGNYVVRFGNFTSANITNLQPNGNYHFALFEYSGSGSGKQYLTTNSTIPTLGDTANQITVAYPTDNATNMTFSNINGNQFYRSFSSGHGNGEKRIVVAKQGSAVTFTPDDGTDYTASTTFGNGDHLIDPLNPLIDTGEYVMYDGTNGTGWVYGLLPNTTYHFKVFEYNGSGTATFYLVGNDDDGDPLYETSQATLDYPTSQASFTVSPFTNIEGTQMTVSWNAGTGGSGRILLAKEGAPVDAEPQDFTNYSTSTTFGNGTQIGSGNYVVRLGNYTSTNITNLQPNGTYHFALFEYSGSGSGRQYLTTSSTISTPGDTANQTTVAYPTDNSSNMTFSNIDGDRFYRSFSSGHGNGEKRIVVAKASSPVTGTPVEDTVYTANGTFGSGDTIAPGEYVMYNGTNGTGWVYGLLPETTYYFKVFEYNDSDTNVYYLTGNDDDSDPVYETSQATISYPTIQSSNAFFDSKTTTSFNLNWTIGNGSNRILIARANDPVNVEPQDFTTYNHSSSGYGNSSYEIGTGNYVIYRGSGNADFVSNLQPGTNYHFSLFEYNGANGKLYLRPGYSFEEETYGITPTIQSSAAVFDNIGASSMKVGFTRGNGSHRLVLAKEASPVDAVPTDYSTYVANGSFGLGEQIGTGNYVVFNGTEDEFDLDNLNLETNYHFAFFEYAIDSSGELYLAPAYTNAQTTPSPPTQICTNYGVTPDCDNDVTVTWTGGNGEGRIVVLSETTLNALPVNTTDYTASFDFGSGDSIGNGFVVFKGSGEIVPPNLLQQYTNYFVNIFEYNGTEIDPIFNTTPLQGLIGDDTPPTMTCTDIIVQLDANGDASIVAIDMDNGSIDDCGIEFLTIDISDFTCADVGPNTVRLTAIDFYGNSNFCDVTVTVQDNIPPVAICQDRTIQLDENGSANISASNSELANSSSDFSDVQGNNGWTYGQYFAFDSTNFTQLPNWSGSLWQDTQSFGTPLIDADGGHPGADDLKWSVRRWTSNYSGDISVSGEFFDRDLGGGDGVHVRIFKNGTQVYEYLNIPSGSTSYNINLNITSGDILDFVIDPIINPLYDNTQFTGTITSAMGIDNGSNDACGIASLSLNTTAFDCNDIGPNTVTLTVTDNNGNQATCMATVTVEDKIKPSLTPVDDFAVNPDANCDFTIPDFTNLSTASDNCTVNPNNTESYSHNTFWS